VGIITRDLAASAISLKPVGLPLNIWTSNLESGSLAARAIKSLVLKQVMKAAADQVAGESSPVHPGAVFDGFEFNFTGDNS
jgi:hypothetical protein